MSQRPASSPFRAAPPRPAAADALTPELHALAAGRFGDPFALLGPHRRGDGTLVLRTLQPAARRVLVVAARDGATVAELPRIDDAGLFAGVLAGTAWPFAYRLRLLEADRETEIEDPYRFGPILGELDLHLFREGTHRELYDRLGAHPRTLDGVAGVAFAVWAPNARRVSVVGPWNDWDGRRHPMRRRPEAGIHELFLPGLAAGALYKYELLGPDGALLPLKADPFAFRQERPPATASIVHRAAAEDEDEAAWRATREARQRRDAPIAIYEAHLGSWRRKPERGGGYLGYDELAEELVPYVAELGFTHLELMPVSEHPFDGSWGYQPLGLFAPTSRFGAPEEFRRFVRKCHAAGIGVVLDWVAGHFPADAHGLADFDGTALYEHADPRQGRHREWDTLVFNYGRPEVANYLLANALFWLRRYGIDALRVDAVASMLYLDYSREPGDWVPNIHGGNENLEAIAFLRRMNETVYGEGAGAVTIAEESTAWPMVSRPTYLGGLGFGYKWNMGWMHDTLAYMSREPVHRRYHLDDLTFAQIYAYHENFVLPLSHDEVVHGKGSLLARMPGDPWQRFANLRAYLAFMWTQPGKKLLFMGGEFAQAEEWNHDRSLDWHLLADPRHAGVQRLVRDLNRLYRSRPALHQLDCEPAGFAWIDCGDVEKSVVSWLRRGRGDAAEVAVVANFTPVPRHGYRIGVPRGGAWREAINTDAAEYGGSGVGNLGRRVAEPVPMHGHAQSLALTLPPLATLVLEPEGAA